MALVGKRVFVKLTKPWTFALATNIGKLAHQTITRLFPTEAGIPCMNQPTIPSRFSSQLTTNYTNNYPIHYQLKVESTKPYTFLNLSLKNNKPLAVITTGVKEPQFNQVQPCVVTSAPDANEVKAMVVNTQKLIAACALSFSCGV